MTTVSEKLEHARRWHYEWLRIREDLEQGCSIEPVNGFTLPNYYSFQNEIPSVKTCYQIVEPIWVNTKTLEATKRDEDIVSWKENETKVVHNPVFEFSDYPSSIRLSRFHFHYRDYKALEMLLSNPRLILQFEKDKTWNSIEGASIFEFFLPKDENSNCRRIPSKDWIITKIFKRKTESYALID